MKKADFDHLIAAAAEISEEAEIVVIGSQAILGNVSEPPASRLRALEDRRRRSLGRAALQHQISLVSIRACWGFDRVLWRSILRASARRPRVPPNPDSDRVLTDVHRRALSVRRHVRSGSRDFLRACCGAFPIAANRKSQIGNRKLKWRRG